MRGYAKAGCAVAVLALVSACGSLHAGNADAKPTTSQTDKALPPICPEAAANVSASPCVSAGVEQNQNCRPPLARPSAGARRAWGIGRTT